MPDLPDELAALLRERADHAPVPAAPSERVVHAVRRRQYTRAGAAASGTALALATIVGVAAAVPRGGTGAVTPLGNDPTPSSAPNDIISCGKSPNGGIARETGGTLPPGSAEHTITLGPGLGEETMTAEPEPTSEPTAEASAEPSAEPSDEETRSTEPSPGKTASATAESGPSAYFDVTVGGTDDAPRFDRSNYAAAAGSCIAVTNKTGARHDLALRDEAGNEVWSGAGIDLAPHAMIVFMGEPPVREGSYTLACRIHRSMRATVDVR